jgi:hypothetical protein
MNVGILLIIFTVAMIAVFTIDHFDGPLAGSIVALIIAIASVSLMFAVQFFAKPTSEMARYEVIDIIEYKEAAYVTENGTINVSKMQAVYDTEIDAPYVSFDRFQLGIFYYNKYRLHIPGEVTDGSNED